MLTEYGKSSVGQTICLDALVARFQLKSEALAVVKPGCFFFLQTLLGNVGAEMSVAA